MKHGFDASLIQINNKSREKQPYLTNLNCSDLNVFVINISCFLQQWGYAMHLRH